MQTLKTAIVVLLLMTVMYGSYVSLTTPPEALPDAVASLIQESGSFDLEIDNGLPETLSNLQVNDRATPSMPDFAAPAFPQDATKPMPSQTVGLSAPAIPAGRHEAVSGNLSDASMSLAPSATGYENTNRIEDLQLPKPNAVASLPKVDTSRDYQQTDANALTLPDPKSLAPLPSSGSGWKKDATPVSFGMPAKEEPVTAKLTDSGSNSFTMPSPSAANDLSTEPLPALASIPQKPTASEPNLGLANAIRTADRQYAADQHMDALATLSLFYNTPDLSPADRQSLINRLDPLAASVIYSRRHLLEQPHRVGATETLMEIATRCEIPWQLLANINGIDDPVAVLPGTELKVLRGPFRAEVDLQRGELTIFLRDLYAGRFPISAGTEPEPQAGTYTIQDKQSARTFYDKNGSPVPPGDSRNPYGSVWMDLGKQLCIHGSPDRTKPTTEGCISLRGADAEDLYGILSQGSSVTIRR